jgi:hypothetical protein
VAPGQLLTGREHDPRRCAREGADHDGAANRLVLRGQLGLGRVELGQHAVGARDERVRGPCEPDPAPVTLQQRDPRLALELGERLGDRRGRVTDGARHLDDRPAPGQLAQEPEPSYVQHSAHLRIEPRLHSVGEHIRDHDDMASPSLLHRARRPRGLRVIT